MNRLNGRLKRLERRREDNSHPWQPWLYWDSYTPEQRAEMNGRVNWIVENRRQNHEQQS